MPMMNSTTIIRDLVSRIEAGKPFHCSRFLDCGTRSTVDKVLSRLVANGTIERVSRGVYMRPKSNRFVGAVAANPADVVRSILAESGMTFQVSGAEAARRLGLTTQVPTQHIYYTTGTSRKIRMGKLVINIRNVSPRKLLLADRPAGLALTAMWYLGRNEVSTATVEDLRHRIGTTEFTALRSVSRQLPAWMSRILIEHEQQYGA
ncbi:MAG: hypothetical protein RIR53_873 [Bacteroidota bacterium]